MEIIEFFLDAFLKFLNGLEVFFFTSLFDLVGGLPSLLPGTFGNFANFLSKILSLFTGLGFFGNLTLFELIFGGGLFVFLIYKLILFLLPIAD